MLAKSLALCISIAVLAFCSGMAGVAMVWKDMFHKMVLMMEKPPEEKYQFEVRRNIESALSDIKLLEAKDYSELEKSACYALQFWSSALAPEKVNDLNFRNRLSQLHVEAGEKLKEMQSTGRCWEEAL